MKEKRHILFVDDEPNILSSLRRMLFSMQSKWKMSFVNNGKEALKILSEEPIDVIVSDLNMPVMDGYELLTKVKKNYPNIVRIAFSGQIDSDQKLHSLRPIHQYINKPVDKKKVVDTINRACSLHDLLSNSELRSLLSRLDSLPSYPFIYQQLVKELESPNASLDKVSKIIAQDVGMSAKMLQFVNSAFFGLPRQITDQK
ncbi:MAG: response regulator, partial [Bacteroidetes bacterium]|nr:response regulator [Bacteroidota bacterium]